MQTKTRPLGMVLGTGWKALAFAALLAVAGCEWVESIESREGGVGYVEGFVGGVVADEPRAALIGRDILASGGTAADAAVAVYFALSVTLPSSASLGGGGVCLVNDGREETRKKVRGKLEQGLYTTETLDFLPRAPKTLPSGATRPTAVPGNARGFFALHSKYGRLRWSQLVAPAENLARFGFQVPRAMARELAAVGPALLGDAEARKIFGRKDGQGVLGEQDFVRQVELSSVLGRLRVKGPGDLYSGALGRQLVEATLEAGGSLDIESLREFTPQWRETVKVPVGDLIAHFPPPPAAAGVVEAQMLRMLIDDDRFADADPTGKRHAVAEAAMRAFADRGQWMNADGSARAPADSLASTERARSLIRGFRPGTHTPAASLRPPPVARAENPAATGFVVVDREGSAVACAVTLNNLFGTGRVAKGTGIVLAAAPDRGGRGYTALSPVLVINHNINDFHAAASGSGGVTGPSAMVGSLARLLLDKQPLDAATDARRVHHGGAPDRLYYEEGLDPAILQALQAKGYETQPAAVLGIVNAISCPDGLPSVSETCSAKADPRGFGLAATADPVK